MACTLWGRVFYHDDYAGVLKEEPGGRTAFQYDPDYLARQLPALAHTLPVQAEPIAGLNGLPPFFDNLVSEGWLQSAQARVLRVDASNRFALLLAFGRDCAGAVSVVDPEPAAETFAPEAVEAYTALQSRASLSGVQPKLFATDVGGTLRPTGPHELSTHIVKLPTVSHPNLVELEAISYLAVRELLPQDQTAGVAIGKLSGIAEEALVVRRFDRDGGRKVHFEEFNSLLGRRCDQKYDGAYEDLGRFMRFTPGCLPVEAERLFRRVIANLLIGNTDAHLKNFAMFHTPGGLRLTPQYDVVASALYPQYDQIALAIGGAASLRLGDVAAKHIVAMGQGFGLNADAIMLAVEDLGKRLPRAQAVVEADRYAQKNLRTGLIELMEKRWNGTYGSIGVLLSTRRERGGKRRGFPSADSR